MRGPLERVYRDLRVPGVKVGQVHDLEAMTGVSVVLFDQPAVAAAHVCGKATSTRQADSLRVDHIVPTIDAMVFTGGSAFGLDATGGVLRFLEQQGRGLKTRHGLVPTCPTAAIFDLGFGSSSVRPDAQMGYDACEAAEGSRMAVGSVGAGCGATVGKLNGIAQAMKGGVGTRSTIEGDLVVQVITVCNAFGDVLDPQSGEILAGARTTPEAKVFLDTQAALSGKAVPVRFFPPDAGNTVLILVVTTAKLDKPACAEVARRASEGLAKVVRPAFAPVDGDIVVVASVGQVPAEMDALSSLAAENLASAVECAVRCADGFGVLPSVSDLSEWGRK